MKIVIAYEWKYNEKHWLHKLLEDAGYEVCIVDMKDVDRRKKLKKWHKVVELYDYYIMAKKAQKYLNEGDIFIGWCFTTAVFASILNKSNNIIIGLNILIQEEKNLANYLRNHLYKKAFENVNFRATSNSTAGMKVALDILGDKYADQFQILHDVFFESRSSNYDYDDYCFCGGASGRDWPTLLKAAKLCPDIKFKVIAGSGTWCDEITIPANVECEFDVSEEQFLQCLQRGKIIILPLISEVTSGLLVLFQAINNNKVVVATGIEAVKYYFPEDIQEKCLVEIGDYEELAKKIKQNYYGYDETIADKLYKYNSERNMKEEYLSCLQSFINGE